MSVPIRPGHVDEQKPIPKPTIPTTKPPLLPENPIPEKYDFRMPLELWEQIQIPDDRHPFKVKFTKNVSLSNYFTLFYVCLKKRPRTFGRPKFAIFLRTAMNVCVNLILNFESCLRFLNLILNLQQIKIKSALLIIATGATFTRFLALWTKIFLAIAVIHVL